MTYDVGNPGPGLGRAQICGSRVNLFLKVSVITYVLNNNNKNNNRLSPYPLFKLVFHNVFRKTTYTLFKRTPRLSPANVSILLLAKSNVSIEGSVREGKYGMMFCPRFNILNEVKPSKDPSSISCIWLSWKSLKHK
jgi:hypothetical protein